MVYGIYNSHDVTVSVNWPYRSICICIGVMFPNTWFWCIRTLCRSWVIVDKNGCFMTQRQHPKMALICPRVEARQTPGGEEEVTLHLSAPEMPDLTLKIPPPSAPTEQIR